VNFTPGFPTGKKGKNGKNGKKGKELPDPKRIDWVFGEWDEYLKSILNYVKEGQDPNFANDPGFKIEVGGQTRWFNVPWMAYDVTVGREFVHGTTNERSAHLVDLLHPRRKRIRTAREMHGVSDLRGVKDTPACIAASKAGFETWSVGYYNSYGAYSIGKSVPPDGVPKTADFMGSQMAAGLPFAQGTVVVKFLTTSATPDCVPYLKGSPEWQIDRHVLQPNGKYSCERKVQTSRIVQMDVAVTDNRSPTGWVYATYVYNGDQRGATTFWEHLLPLGIQFGSDPWTFPAVPKAESLPLQQSVINPAVNGYERFTSLYQHLGCEGRLAGPVDNAQSSCLSCHGSAFAAPVGQVTQLGTNVPASFGFPGMCTNYSTANAAYFNNIIAPQSFSSGTFPNAIGLDTSLQLEVAFQQYGNFATKQANSCGLKQ
jgi:hypothetical protein